MKYLKDLPPYNKKDWETIRTPSRTYRSYYIRPDGQMEAHKQYLHSMKTFAENHEKAKTNKKPWMKTPQYWEDRAAYETDRYLCNPWRKDDYNGAYPVLKGRGARYNVSNAELAAGISGDDPAVWYLHNIERWWRGYRHQPLNDYYKKVCSMPLPKDFILEIESRYLIVAVVGRVALGMDVPGDQHWYFKILESGKNCH